MLRCFWTVALVVLFVDAAKKTGDPVINSKNPPATGGGKGQQQQAIAKEAESVIEEVNAKQLERVLNEKDYVAVFWCKFCCL